MAPFRLRACENNSNDFCGPLEVIESSDDLSTFWKICTKVKDNLEHGSRLENTSWRIWHLSKVHSTDDKIISAAVKRARAMLSLDDATAPLSPIPRAIKLPCPSNVPAQSNKASGAYTANLGKPSKPANRIPHSVKRSKPPRAKYLTTTSSARSEIVEAATSRSVDQIDSVAASSTTVVASNAVNSNYSPAVATPSAGDVRLPGSSSLANAKTSGSPAPSVGALPPSAGSAFNATSTFMPFPSPNTYSNIFSSLTFNPATIPTLPNASTFAASASSSDRLSIGSYFDMFTYPGDVTAELPSPLALDSCNVSITEVPSLVDPLTSIGYPGLGVNGWQPTFAPTLPPTYPLTADLTRSAKVTMSAGAAETTIATSPSFDSIADSSSQLVVPFWLPDSMVISDGPSNPLPEPSSNDPVLPKFTLSDLPKPKKVNDVLNKDLKKQKPSASTPAPAAPACSGGPGLCCANCGATSTPLWRRSPFPLPTSTTSSLLCNACGLYFKLHNKHRPKSLRPHVSRKDANGECVIECANCATRTTPLWRRDGEGKMLCNACGLYLKMHKEKRPMSMKTEVIRKRQRFETGGPSVSGEQWKEEWDGENERESRREEKVSRRDELQTSSSSTSGAGSVTSSMVADFDQTMAGITVPVATEQEMEAYYEAAYSAAAAAIAAVWNGPGTQEQA
ncbi:hypothetical protein BJ742DRAFT_795758 [Cladochytrium replicatum]|nr:hypothetical protein BJ742DRAFT_795758 [Cladochytrium replicatum]